MGGVGQQLNVIHSRSLDVRHPFLKPSLQYPGCTDLHRRLVMFRNRQKPSNGASAP